MKTTHAAHSSCARSTRHFVLSIAPILAATACAATPASLDPDGTMSSSAAITETVYGWPVCVANADVCEQTPEKAPYCATGPLPVVTFHGTGASDIVATPHVFMLHMGSYWSTTAGEADLDQDNWAWSIISKDARFWDPMAEYAPTGVKFAPPLTFGDYLDTALAFPASGNVSDGTVISQVVADITNGLVPSPSAQPGIIYVVRLPTGVGTVDCPLGGVGCASYHTATYIGEDRVNIAMIMGSPNYENTTNPLVPTALLRGQDWVTSHEIYETTTDPQATGWYQMYCGEGLEEVADLCTSFTPKPIDGFTVATMWSQENSGCVGPYEVGTTADSKPACPSGTSWGASGCMCPAGEFWFTNGGSIAECMKDVSPVPVGIAP